MKPYGIIYLITNKVNGKKYVGQTVRGIKKRLAGHIQYAKNGNRGSVLHKAIRKYGDDNFIIEQICECNNQEELNNMEMHYILEYDTIIDNKKGYNMTYGGGEYIPSEETRKKMSASQKKRFLNLDELEKMRQRTIEQFNDPQKRENHKNSQIKRFENSEEIQKYRIKMIKYFEDNPKFMENHSNWMKEYYKNPLSREKVSIATKEAMARPKVRENFLCGIKKSMENPERRKKCGNGSRGKHWYHKGSISKFFFDNNVPVGWELGRS
jgi:group I intron endonuclease